MYSIWWIYENINLWNAKIQYFDFPQKTGPKFNDERLLLLYRSGHRHQPWLSASLMSVVCWNSITNFLNVLETSVKSFRNTWWGTDLQTNILVSKSGLICFNLIASNPRYSWVYIISDKVVVKWKCFLDSLKRLAMDQKNCYIRVITAFSFL